MLHTGASKWTPRGVQHSCGTRPEAVEVGLSTVEVGLPAVEVNATAVEVGQQ